jgi:hypothetical protein
VHWYTTESKAFSRNADGTVTCSNRVIGKISREEVARKFFSPPPAKIVNWLLEKGLVSSTEAELSCHVPMAEMLTAEADSGGHTDNRPALSLLPTIIALRNQLSEKHAYANCRCVSGSVAGSPHLKRCRCRIFHGGSVRIDRHHSPVLQRRPEPRIRSENFWPKPGRQMLPWRRQPICLKWG